MREVQCDVCLYLRNAVRESEIKTVIAVGVRDVDDVYEKLEIESQCSTCRAFILEILTQSPSCTEPEIAA